jgi:hypothetical protein
VPFDHPRTDLMQGDGVTLPLPSQVVKRLLDLGVPRTATSETSDGFELNYFDFTALKIRSSHFTSVIYSRKQPRGASLSFEDIDDLVSQAERAIATRQRLPGDRRDEVFIILIQTGTLPLAVREKRSLPRHPKMVVLDGSDCRAILDSTQQSDALRTVSRACALALGALELSPYEMGAPAAGYRFFDRRGLLRRVSSKPTTSITLIGTRRIGKTSVLHELKRQLTSKHDDLLVAHLYGSNLHNSYDVLLRIIEDTYHAARLARFQLDRDEKTLWNDMRKLIQSGKHRLAIFIDEFDHILVDRT